MKVFKQILVFLFAAIASTEQNFDQFAEEVINFIDATSDYVAPGNNDAYFEGEDSNNGEATDFGTYDFIIVGAGTAGGIVANRLSEIKHFKVLLVEAGKADPPISKVLGLYGYLASSEYNWGYNTIPQDNACLANTNRSCSYVRGKTLGGSSSVDDGYYTRGNRKDYDKWAELSGADWSYADCLPYFRKSEKADFTKDIDRRYHGFFGPQHINVAEDTAPLSQEIINAFKELNKTEGDYNAVSQESVGRAQLYLDYNTRSSTAYSYIHPALKRPNFHISLESLVSKISFANNSIATGIEFWKNGTKYIANASREVIVSAGALNSPQVLMLSGIGPKKHLKELGIEVIADLPVGQNLVDHVAVNALHYRQNRSYYNNTLRQNLDLWKNNHRPLTAGAHLVAVTYYHLLENKNDSPEVEILVEGPPEMSPSFGSSIGLEDSYAEAFEVLNPYTDFCVSLALMQPKSVGNVTLQSADPRDFPLINPNFYSHPADLEILYKGLKTVEPLINTTAFKRLGVEPLFITLPGCDSQKTSKEWWYCYFQHTSYAGLHASGTNRMGKDEASSVVSGTNLKVHGFSNLRVVDASVFPTTVTGHMNAPVTMVAEKASDIIKSDHIV